MKRMTLLVIGWSLIGQLSLSAQAVDEVLTMKEQINKYDESISLEESLRFLENKHDVTLIYESRLVVDKVVPKRIIEARDFQTALTELAGILNLEYQQVGDRSFFLSAQEDFRQERIVQETVTGTVTDAQSGETLPGVNVMVKGTTTGTSTGSEGSFELTVESLQDTLIFSFVGYQTQEVPINRAEIDVALQSQAIAGEELVVVGYGEQSKRKISTAVSRVSGEEINELTVASAGEALAGLVTGVQVQSGSGSTPGDNPIIRIRGIGSLGASNSPLFVVDGYPLQSANQFSRIDVSDIESIEVLKDAASAAIYGSRAANGVVLVTTKKGEAGNLNFTVNASSGIQSVVKQYEMMNTAEYVQYSQDAHAANGRQVHPIFSTPEEMANTNWQEEISRNAPMTEIKMNANGGSENFQFLISGSYQNQKGTIIGTDYQIANFRTNLNAELSDKLKIGVNFAPSYTYKNIASNSAGVTGPSAWTHPIYGALLTPPYIPVKLENGEYGHYNSDNYFSPDYSFGPMFNPLSYLELYDNNRQQFGLLNNAFITFQPFENLEIKTQGGIVYNSSTQNRYVPSSLRYSQSPDASFSNPSLQGIQSSTQSGKSTDWVWENTLTYTRTLNDLHNLEGLFLFSLQKYDSNVVSTRGRDQTFTNDLIHNPTASTDQAGSINYGLNSFMSYAGRLSYDFDDKYLLTASIRADGSSRFGPDKRFGTFKSFSLGWRITEEEFMSEQTFFDELKIRASYGETGNANIGNFPWVSGIRTYNYSYDGRRVAGTAKNGFLNRNLTWEKNSQIDLGLEASVLSDKMYITFDIYEKTTNGMLFEKELPGVVGYAQSFTTNIGEIKNQGIELDLLTQNIERNSFNWNTNFNVSYNRTKVNDLGGRESLNARAGTAGWSDVYKIEVGEPIGNMHGFIIDGVFRSQEELDNYPSWTGSGVGDYKIRDVNNDNIIDENDRTLLGNGFPDLIYGITNNFSYKNFDMNLIIQGVIGNQIIDGTFRHAALWVGRHNAVKDMADNYFDPDNPERDVKYARVGNRSGFNTAAELHSYAVHNGDYLRVKNLTIGYSLPTTLSNKLSVRNTRLYLTAQNVLTFTNYPGLNPEPSQYGSSVYQPGSDQATYPVNRIVTLGVNLEF